jgi:cytochrome P450
LRGAATGGTHRRIAQPDFAGGFGQLSGGPGTCEKKDGLMTESSLETLDRPEIIFDPYSIEFATDPYPLYERLREEAPVFHQKDLNFWALSRYEDVAKASADIKRFGHFGGVSIEGYEAGNPAMLLLDGKEHSVAKAMMVKLFSKARMAELDTFIREKAIRLLEETAEKASGGEVNFVSEVTVKLPLEVISELIGIPESVREEIHHLCNIWVSRGDAIDPAAQMAGMEKLLDIYRGLVAERRKNPKDDPISMLIQAEVVDQDGVKHKMDDNTIAHRFNELGLAGHETVAKAIPNGAMAMAKFPGERAKLANDLSLLPQAVLEIVRYDPPSHLQGRTTFCDVEYYGTTIPKNSKVMLLTAAATRDPRAFPDADKFIIDREPDKNNIAFGNGVHKCLGVHLAQREISVVFEELFTRFPDWQVFPDRTTRSVLSNVRGVNELPINFGRHA